MLKKTINDWYKLKAAELLAQAALLYASGKTEEADKLMIEHRNYKSAI